MDAESSSFKFLMFQKTGLNFRFVWLENEPEVNLSENLHSNGSSDLISWLDFLLDNLFLYCGQGIYRDWISIEMGTICTVY